MFMSDNQMKNNSLPFNLTKNLESILNNLKKNHLDTSGIENQVIPKNEEFNFFPQETDDPLGGECYKKTQNFIHQYKNRGLILTTSNCFSYCRYCFRKNFVSNNNTIIDETQLNAICDYLKDNPQIKELLFSGGDPLVLSDKKIDEMIFKIKTIRPNMIIRICSRAIFFAPERITDSLISIFKKYSGIWFIPHINHPYEIDSIYAQNSVDSILKLRNSGIPIQSQTVLLKNVNDNLDTLVLLFNKLVELGIKPGYLFQCDLAKGISHFRVPLDEACKLYSDLKEELSGLSLPKFAVDLPGGGGKFNLDFLTEKKCTVTQNDEEYIFTKDNLLYKYPKI